MNAPTTITAARHYTAETCKRIVAACEQELANRKAAPPAWQYAGEMSFRAGLREVMYCATTAQDDPSGHDALHAALCDLDHFPLWEVAS
jgi:hypothetical protein